MEILRIALETFISAAMERSDLQIFVNLFREVCRKCFGRDLTIPLSEAESKQLSTTIFERTGLVIGVKSLKNYSQFVTGSGREENPSIATLDTLARFLMDAPPIDEIVRKDRELHHPYWFEYKRTHLQGKSPAERVFAPKASRKGITQVVLIILMCVVGASVIFYVSQQDTQDRFTEDFNSVDDSSLAGRGWSVISKNMKWWERRAEKDGHLTLYTLTGDNWSDSSHTSNISNLLVKEIDASCFSAEVHFSNFVPVDNWEQAGLLLLEDTLPTSKGIRFSLAYNSFFGGYDQAPEIIIQAISSLDVGGFRKPEEFIHLPLARVDSTVTDLIRHNLSRSALRIEKSGSTFRFLYSAGPMENTAFKEAAIRDLKISPRYIGIFAIHGFIDTKEVTPVYVDKFVSATIGCR